MTKRGRTLWEILWGLNKQDITPIEFQYHNPLKAKVGNSIVFQNEPGLADKNFFIEKIAVYRTDIGRNTFFHTDYLLKAVTLDDLKPTRVRLRLIPDDDAPTKLRCRVQVLRVMDEFGWDDGFHNVLTTETEFNIDSDPEGNPLPEQLKFWRVDDVRDSYSADLAEMADKNGDGTVQQEELNHSKIEYWDYHRDKVTSQGEPAGREYVWVEMDSNTHYFTLLCGTDISATEISII